jgi:hypothetical protein
MDTPNTMNIFDGFDNNPEWEINAFESSDLSKVGLDYDAR